MEADTQSTFSHVAPPVFDGQNYQAWAIRMTVYLEALDLWEAVEEDYDVPPLPANPTVAQMKNHKERKTRKSKAKACLFSAVSSTIFTRIMNLESAKNIWDYLKKEYQGNERTKNMQVLNLIREFEMVKMKESETIKDYSDKLLGIVNKVRLLGKDFSDERIVQKILVTLPEKYESKISSLEESKDLSSISLAELVNALQAQEQRRMMRKEEVVEGALQAKAETSGGKDNKNNNMKRYNKPGSSNQSKDEMYPSCPHCKKTNHPQRKCWWRPDVKCRKCGQLGHIERICKSQQVEAEAKAADVQIEEEQLFVATCFATSNSSSDSWLIDSGCTNHMTNDQELFQELDKTTISKVKIGNGEFISVKGKGTVAIESLTGLKYISDVLYVPDIDQNLLSVGQLIEKGFKVIFEDKWCLIKDAKGRDVFKVKMRAKSFALNLMEEEHIAFSSTTSNAELWHKRDGPTLWEIGIPDRSAAEFYIPDPDPKFVNKLFINHPDRFRQYGLWDRYAELYPDDEILNGEYYLLPVSRKLIILQILCDEVLESEELKTEINMREESEVGMDYDADDIIPAESMSRRVHPRYVKTSAAIKARRSVGNMPKTAAMWDV